MPERDENTCDRFSRSNESALGHSRRFGHVLSWSGVTQQAELRSAVRYFGIAPKGDLFSTTRQPRRPALTEVQCLHPPPHPAHIIVIRRSELTAHLGFFEGDM